MQEKRLAYNAALHVHRVYSKRSELSEGKKPNPYGYRTWWLTQRTRILRQTQSLTKKGGFYIIRPEFLLNYIALAPDKKEVVKSFSTIFPSILGVKLSNRMDEEAFKKVVIQVKDAQRLSPPRARAKVCELSDKLKGDHFKEYAIELANTKEA